MNFTYAAKNALKCIYCGAPFEHVDHYIPKSRGGSDESYNLYPSCAYCNLDKSDKLAGFEWWPSIRRIMSVAAGEPVPTPRARRKSGRNREDITERSSAHLYSTPLSRRETEVVRLVAEGKVNSEIAKVLDISLQTVKNHMTAIFGKTGALNRTECVNRAREHGYI